MKNAIRFIALLACVLAATALSAASLTTTYAGSNAHRGIMFDVVAKQDITITRFDIAMETAGEVGDTFEIYGRSGSYAGFSNSSAGWTLLGSTTVNTNNGEGVATPIPITLNQPIPAGTTYAFYLTRTGSYSVQYSDGTAEFAVFTENADLQILEGRGLEYPFGNSFTPRVFNGTIYYEPTAPPVPTASEWALIAMALGLALLAFTRLR